MNYKYNIALILLLNLSLNFSVYAMEEQGKEKEFDNAHKHLAMHTEVAQAGDESDEEQVEVHSTVETRKLHLLNLPTELILSINDFLKPRPEASCEQILEQLEDILMFSESSKALQATLENEIVKHIKTNLDHYGAITNFNNDNLFVAAVKDRKYKLASLLLSLSEQFNIEILNLAEIKLFFAWAVSNGYSQIATICLSFIEEKTLTVNMLNKTSKETLLHLASMNGNENCVELLLDNGADVNPLDSNNNIPLDWACRYGHLNAATVLVRNHANINSQNKRINYIATPLKYAVIYGKKNVLEFLLDNGADVNSNNIDDFSPLECAMLASNGTASHDEIIAALLSHGATETNLKSIVDKDRALFFAIYFNCCGTARLLLIDGANIEAKNSLGNTPLISAIHNEKIDMVKLLIENGVNIRTKSINGNTALGNAIYSPNYEICKLFSSCKEFINEPVSNGLSPLLYAILENNDLQIIKLLIDLGANVNSIYRNGDSILMSTICSDIKPKIKLKIIKLLIKNGAKVNFINNREGATPLIYSVFGNQYEIAKLLIKRGANIYHAAFNKQTALDIAKNKQYQEMIQLLTDAKKRGNRCK